MSLTEVEVGAEVMLTNTNYLFSTPGSVTLTDKLVSKVHAPSKVLLIRIFSKLYR